MIHGNPSILLDTFGYMVSHTIGVDHSHMEQVPVSRSMRVFTVCSPGSPVTFDPHFSSTCPRTPSEPAPGICRPLQDDRDDLSLSDLDLSS